MSGREVLTEDPYDARQVGAVSHRYTDLMWTGTDGVPDTSRT